MPPSRVNSVRFDDSPVVIELAVLRNQLQGQHAGHPIGRRAVRPKSAESATKVQVIDIKREKDDTVGTVMMELSPESLPPISFGTLVRWIHLENEPHDPNMFLRFVLQNQSLDKSTALSVCMLLEQFRKDQERDSNHGRYYEPSYLRKLSHDPSIKGPGFEFLSIPYVTYGKPPPAVSEIRRCQHPVRSLFQHHYRRESPGAIARRDGEQICMKVRGQGTEHVVLINYLWILVINETTIITSTPTSASQLWQKFRLLPPVQSGAQRETDTVSVYFHPALRRNSLTNLSKDANDKLTGLVRMQIRINEILPPFLTGILKKYESFVLRNSLQWRLMDSTVLRGVFGPASRVLVWTVKSMAMVFTDRKWVKELSEHLARFTQFTTENMNRWQELESTEPFSSSDELQAQLVSLYSKILIYASCFLRDDLPLVKKTTWKTYIDQLFEDVQQLSVVIEWSAESIEMKAKVFADAGVNVVDPSGTKPTTVQEILNLVIDSHIPEDSLNTSRAYISEIYAQHLSRLQFMSQQTPTKAVVRDINQIAEEVEIMGRLVKSQQKVLEQVKLEKPNSCAKLDVTMQKLEFFHSDLEEYRQSCSRLASLTAQQVELQMEHHGKAILVFTVVTIIFLPLSFVSSFFGMNVADVRAMQGTQWIFWVTAIVTTVVVVGLSLIVAFLGDDVAKTAKRWATGQVDGQME